MSQQEVIEPGHHEPPAGPALLEARGISKSYGAIQALDGVDFTVHAGEVVGLIGDNGAGKSTLIKVLCGAMAPDAGVLRIDGEQVTLRTPAQAQALGIDTVYQDLALFDDLSVAANVFAGRERVRKSRLLKHREMNDFTRDLVETLGVDVPNPKTLVRNLSGGQRQAVALARAAAFDSKIVFLDEPTAALSKGAAERMLEIIKDLREHGLGVVFIAHNIDHILEASDRIVVLRRGLVVGERTASETDLRELVSLMVGG